MVHLLGETGEVNEGMDNYYIHYMVWIITILDALKQRHILNLRSENKLENENKCVYLYSPDPQNVR